MVDAERTRAALLDAAVQQAWLHRRDGFAEPGLSPAESLAHYLHDALSDPRPMRLPAWRGLAGVGLSVTIDMSHSYEGSDHNVVRRTGENRPGHRGTTSHLTAVRWLGRGEAEDRIKQVREAVA